MGVKGLQSFLKNNVAVSQVRDIADTSLVIDANNLLCCLFANQCNDRDSPQMRSDVYGGDLVSYSELVRNFFSQLDKCNITPILVFDGSVIGKKSTQDQLALKETTIYKRGLESFESSKTTSEERPNDKLGMPQILSQCFKNIANDLGIQRIQSPFEADAHIARLANELNCPVLTNDSDFIIYSLPKGFIMIDSFHYEKPAKKNGKNFITCSVYHQDYLVKVLPGLRYENMPLLSILLGNDYVEAGTFDRINNSICGRSYHGMMITNSFAHRRIAGLLDWLRGKSQQEAIEYVLSQVHPNSRQKLQQTISVLLRSYKLEEMDNFESELDEIYSSNSIRFQAIGDQDLKPSNYIRGLMENSNLPSLCLDIIFHNTHYTYGAVEDFQLPSSSYVKFRPISLGLALLRPTSYEGLSTYRRLLAVERDTYYIYDRYKGEYTRLSVKPMETLEGFGSLELMNFYTTMNLENHLKSSILMSTFRFNNEEWNLLCDVFKGIFLDPFAQEASLCLMLVKYIGIETKVNPKPQFVDALVLTLFYYAALNGKLVKNCFPDAEYGKLLLRLRPHANTSNAITYPPSESLYRRIVHFIRQLHHAYVGYTLINSLLNHALPKARFDKFINGTLIFRLTKLLRIRQLDLQSLCNELPNLLDACSTIKVLVHADE